MKEEKNILSLSIFEETVVENISSLVTSKIHRFRKLSKHGFHNNLETICTWKAPKYRMYLKTNFKN